MICGDHYSVETDPKTLKKYIETMTANPCFAQAALGAVAKRSHPKPVQKPNPQEINRPAGPLVAFQGASNASRMRPAEVQAMA